MYSTCLFFYKEILDVKNHNDFLVLAIVYSHSKRITLKFEKFQHVKIFLNLFVFNSYFAILKWVKLTLIHDCLKNRP